MSLRDLPIGTPVLYQYLNPRHSPREGWAITEKGRKWGYASNGSWSVKFDLDSGYEDGGQYTSPGRILTQEILADEQRRQIVLDRLKKALGVSYIPARPYSTATLEAVADLLEQSGDRT